MQFYDVKARQKVNVSDSQLTKKRYQRTTKNGAKQVRYAARAKHKGTSLTRFISETDFNKLNVPVEK